MTPQKIGSLVGLKYLGPQNVLELIERWMRRSSEALVPWGPISHRQLLYLLLLLMPPESSSFAVLTVSFSLFDNRHYSHPPIFSFCPALNFFPFSSSSAFIHPTSFFRLPRHTHSARPWKSLGFPALSWSTKHCNRHLSQPPPALPQLYCREHLDQYTVERPAKSQSAFTMRQRVQKSEGPIFNSIFQSTEDYCHRVGILDPGHFCWSQDS